MLLLLFFAVVTNISVYVVLVARIAFSLTCSVDLSRYYLLVSASSAVLARRYCWHLSTSMLSHCPAVIFRDQRHPPAAIIACKCSLDRYASSCVLCLFVCLLIVVIIVFLLLFFAAVIDISVSHCSRFLH